MHNEHNENEKHNELNVVNVFEPQVNHGFVLTEKEREEIEGEKHHYEDARAASIEALKIVQKTAVGLKMVRSMLSLTS